MKNLRTYFFATGEDLINILNEFNEKENLYYISNEISKSSDLYKHENLLPLDSIGISIRGSSKEQMYKIYTKTEQITIDTVKQLQSEDIHYFARGGINMFLGGMYKGEALLMSEINMMVTDETSDETVKLFRRLTKYIKKHCPKKDGKYYYNDEVEELGKRIRLVYNTIACSPEYDFN
ncbi:MAG: hypothetical protein R3Y54_13540 [Eubacteriales bacterium]